MKRIFAQAVALLAVIVSSSADQFQIKEGEGAVTADIGYAKVKIMNGTSMVSKGRTDKYGRITVNIPKGKYEAVVTSGTTNVTVGLVVDGDKKLKQTVVKEK